MPYRLNLDRKEDFTQKGMYLYFRNPQYGPMGHGNRQRLQSKQTARNSWSPAKARCSATVRAKYRRPFRCRNRIQAKWPDRLQACHIQRRLNRQTKFWFNRRKWSAMAKNRTNRTCKNTECESFCKKWYEKISNKMMAKLNFDWVQITTGNKIIMDNQSILMFLMILF